MTVRSAGVFAAALLLAATLAACSSDQSSGPSGSSASTSATPSGSATGSGSASSGSPEFPTSSAPTGPLDCINDQITVTYSDPPGGGAAGHSGIVLLFTNSSPVSCVLSGYPGVDGLDSTGHTVASASRTLDGMIGFCHCAKPGSFTLKAGDAVSAVTEGTISGGSDCSPFASMLVTPPNTSISTPIPVAPNSCGFTVHPVVAGVTGQAS